MMGVVWHGNYFRYFEIAREALLNQFDYGYRQMKASGYVWPVVDTRVKYRDAVTFEQRIRVRAHVEEYENRLRIAYQIFDAQTGKRTTTGYTIQVAVEEATREMCFVSPQYCLNEWSDAMKWWPLLALLVSPLVSAVTLDELQQRFTGQPVVRAHFEQVRTIKDMPQPLRSQGEMLIARDSGLLWDQKAPFPIRSCWTTSGWFRPLTASRRRPSPPTIIRRCSSSTIFCGPCSRPTAGCLKRTSASILKTWERAAVAGAYAKNDAAGQDFRHPRSGRRDLSETIRLNDKQGDRTDIALSRHQLTPASLTDDERQRFAAP